MEGGRWEVRSIVRLSLECVSVAARGVRARIKAMVIVTSSPKCAFARVGALALI